MSFNNKSALAFLELEVPKLPRRGMSQKEADDYIEEWKKKDLLRAFKKKRREFHPDAGGSQEDFVEALRAYEYLESHLKVRVSEKRCSNCRTRVEEGWVFCPECANPLTISSSPMCRSCGEEKTYKESKYCTKCGSFHHDHQDLLYRECLKMGMSTHQIHEAMREGVYGQWSSIVPSVINMISDKSRLHIQIKIWMLDKGYRKRF